MKKQEFKKMRSLGISGQLKTFQHLNHRVLEGEEEDQEIENLFEKTMKEKFPNLAKEIDSQEVQEAQRPKEVGPKEAHTKAHYNYGSQD